ncbi:hypothetical protein EKO27_g11026 [Xylaria grammica]|uniref:Uncharacterized protein n=1 Tax=Xylaria grammica TaxID=363999 RepID=A0A439CPJ7_9PEZI|nr:hypothetical protein EKO27_g11026 [Xylaria grammica]
MEFKPKVVEAKAEVLNPSFITQTIPNVHRYAGVVGLCTVPEEKADVDDLGWHIADFLAFRALLCGENVPQAQSWLSLCDIHTLVRQNPDEYVMTPTGLAEREDNIQVETSAEGLKDKFIAGVKSKLKVLKKYQYPLLIIICGLTSLEQDIYFGKLDINHRYTMKDFRQDLGDHINHIDAIVVTPSLFSAGWQVNTSFGRAKSTGVHGSRDDFLARQFGGLFAQNLTRNFLGWKCPALDEDKVDPQVKKERFPGPVCPSGDVKSLISQLQIRIQSCLVGGLSAHHMDHSFSFDKDKDEWEILIGYRERPLDYQSLSWYEQKWTKLESSSVQSFEPTKESLAFLGNAFGGTKTSQLNHIRYLIEESYLAWPDHWASNFGQETKKDFELFMNTNYPDSLDCHEVFNVLEHRARTSILADTIVQYFDLPMPRNERCRDCDNLQWKQALSETDRSSLLKHFGTVLACIPGPNVPPGVNPNNLSRLQRRLESAAGYIRASLGIRLLTSKDSSVVGRIESFLQGVERKQVELLASCPEIYQICCSWLNSINMPARDLHNAIAATKHSQGVVVPEDTIDILDGDDEYDVYQDEDGRFDSAVSSTVVENFCDEPVHGQHPYPLPFGTPSLALQQFENTATSGIDENVGLQDEMVNLQARETRLLNQIQATNDRKMRTQLTTKLLELLQRIDSLAEGPKASRTNDVAQGGAFGAADDEVMSTVSFTEAEKRALREKDEEAVYLEPKPTRMPRLEERVQREEREILQHAVLQANRGTEALSGTEGWRQKEGREAMARIEAQQAKVLQEALGKVTRQARGEPVMSGRRTPPHLRGRRS